MGKPMSRNLLKAGYSLLVYDVNPAPLAELTAAGAEKGSSCSDVAARSDVIVTMLPDGPDVEKAVLGPAGVLEGARKGSVIVDMSSISPLVSQKLAADCAAKGVDFIDAPVSGGEPKAIDGTLAIMVGGDAAVFARVEPILQKMGSSVTLTGAVGAGNVTKLANQIVVALNIAAVSEALVLASKVGVAPELVFQAIRGGLAGSTVMDAKAPLMLDRKFNPGFRINLHIKDLANALDTAHEVGAPLPLTASVMEIMQALKADGLGDSDHGALVRYFEKLAKVELKRCPAG